MDSFRSSSSGSAEPRLPRAPQRLLQSADASLFVEYRPPARDSISAPPQVLYVTVGLVLVLIVGHLIDDLLHDLADYLFGQQPEEALINLCEARDKFMADWCPETSPELEEMARAEEIRGVMEGPRYTPAIWIISDGIEPRAPRSSPRVAFGKNV